MQRAFLAKALALVVLAAVLTAPGVNASAQSGGATPSYHRINGNPDGKSGLEVWRGSCISSGSAGDTDGFQFGYGNGQPVPYGPLSIAWRPDTTNSAIAVRAYTKTPAAVDRFDVQIYHPTTSVSGFASVAFYPDTAVDEVWLGRSAIIDSTPGWHEIDAADAVYTWTHLVRGAPDGAPSVTGTLADFAQSHRGPRDAARMGFAFGCEGGVSYVDGLRVGSTTRGWDVYDLVGKPSSISLKVKGSPTTCQVSAKSYPGTVKVRGKVKGVSNWGLWKVNSRGRLTKKIAGGRAHKGRFSTRVKVARNGVIAAYASHTSTTEAAISKAYRVAAVPQISVSADKRSSVRGRSLTASGKVNPGGVSKYTVLYTHWTGSHWTPFKAVGHGKTNRQGRYRVKAPTGELGYSRVSILTKATKKLRGALTRSSATYLVTPKPQPPPPSNGGSSSQPPPQYTGNSTQEAPPTPVTPTEGQDNLPDPMPSPGRMIASSSKGGFGACGWKPARGRPNH